MPNNDNDMRDRISGYLDDELNPEERARFEEQLQRDPALREEYEQMKFTVDAAQRVRCEDPPEEEWDRFMQGIYNRAERGVGWALILFGLIVWAGIGAYCFVVDPFTDALTKLLIAAPVVGLAVLFASILRQRLHVARRDRYSREVQR